MSESIEFIVHQPGRYMLHGTGSVERIGPLVGEDVLAFRVTEQYIDPDGTRVFSKIVPLDENRGDGQPAPKTREQQEDAMAILEDVQESLKATLRVYADHDFVPYATIEALSEEFQERIKNNG